MRRLSMAVLIGALLAVPLSVLATPGEVDTGYGDNGLAVIPSVTSTVGVPSLEAAPDGRVAVSLATDPEAGFVSVVSADGAEVTDIPLPGPGVATFGPGGPVYAAYADGGQAHVARYLADGSADPSFGIGGVSTVDLAGAFPSEVLAAGGEVLVAGGSLDDPVGWVARFDDGGSLDAGFGDSGVATLTPDGPADFVSVGDVHVIDSGYLVVVLIRHVDGDRVVVFALDSAGEPEVVWEFESEDEIFAADSHQLLDGSLVVAVQTTLEDIDTFELVGFAADGTQNTFGATLTDDEVGGPVHLTQLRTGEIVVAYSVGPEPVFLLRLVGTDGSDEGDLALSPDVPEVWIHGIATSLVDGGLLIAVDESPVSSSEPDDLSILKLVGDDSGRFVDDDGSVHEADIEQLAALEVTKGCNPPLNTLFCPEDDVTRGQMAAFLVRALDLPAGPADAFVDDDGSIFEGDIDRLAAAGITKGCNPPTNTMFCPDDEVTREQMAAFLVRALDLPAGPVDAFVDDDGSIFEGDIDRLAAAGITKGCNPPDNTMFCPDDPVTREQMASFLVRALEG